MTASPECADLPLRSTAELNGPHRLLPAAGPQYAGWLRSMRPAQANRLLRLTPTFGPSRLMSVPPPVLRPLLTSAWPAPTSRCGPSARRQRQHNRHPGRPPRIRTINFSLRPPRLPDDPVDGDGLHLLEPAHPDRPAFYTVRVPRCRDTPRASFPPRLTTAQFPRLGVHPTSSSRGLSPPIDRPCRAYSMVGAADRLRRPAGAPLTRRPRSGQSAVRKTALPSWHALR